MISCCLFCEMEAVILKLNVEAVKDGCYLAKSTDGTYYKIPIEMYSGEIMEIEPNRYIDLRFAAGDNTEGITQLSDVEEKQTPNTEGTTQDSDVEEKQTPAAKSFWEYNATLFLISIMETYLDDLKHPKKSKHVFSNKWKSLIRTYKTACDNKSRTGRGPSRFNFFKQMDALLGEKPISSCNHTSSSALTRKREEMDQSKAQNSHKKPEVEETQHKDVTDEEEQKQKNCGRKRKSQISIQENWLEMKKQESIEKKERHRQILELETKRLEIEEKKLALLQKINEKL